MCRNGTCNNCLDKLCICGKWNQCNEVCELCISNGIYTSEDYIEHCKYFKYFRECVLNLI